MNNKEYETKQTVEAYLLTKDSFLPFCNESLLKDNEKLAGMKEGSWGNRNEKELE